MKQGTVRQNLPTHGFTYHTKTRLTEVEIRLFLRDSTERFLNWLQSYLQDVHGHLFLGNYDAQYITLEPSQPQRAANEEFVLTMTGMFQDYSGSQIPIGFEPVRFELRKGIGEQTAVIIRLWNFRDLVASFLDRLLTAIVERWSEVNDLMEVRTLQLGLVDDDTWSMWAGATERLRAKWGAFPRPGTESTALALKAVASTASPSPTADYDIAAVRELLLAAFTAPDLRRLFLYTSNPELRPLTLEFSDHDGLATLVDKTITYCQTHALLPGLLHALEQVNPRMYTRFAGRLTAGREPAVPPAAGGAAYTVHIQHAQGVAIGDGARAISGGESHEPDNEEGA